MSACQKLPPNVFFFCFEKGDSKWRFLTAAQQVACVFVCLSNKNKSWRPNSIASMCGAKKEKKKLEEEIQS